MNATPVHRGRHARRPDWPQVRMSLIVLADVAMFYAGWFTHAHRVLPLIFACVVLVAARWWAIR